MALVAIVRATVTYTCRLSEEDEQKVLDYIRDIDLSTADAIMELYCEGKIDLYKNSTESDFDTKYIEGIYKEEKKE